MSCESNAWISLHVIWFHVLCPMCSTFFVKDPAELSLFGYRPPSENMSLKHVSSKNLLLWVVPGMSFQMGVHGQINGGCLTWKGFRTPKGVPVLNGSDYHYILIKHATVMMNVPAFPTAPATKPELYEVLKTIENCLLKQFSENQYVCSLFSWHPELFVFGCEPPIWNDVVPGTFPLNISRQTTQKMTCILATNAHLTICCSRDLPPPEAKIWIENVHSERIYIQRFAPHFLDFSKIADLQSSWACRSAIFQRLKHNIML